MNPPWSFSLIQLYWNKYKNTSMIQTHIYKTDWLYLTCLRFLKVHLNLWNTCLILTKWTNFILKLFLCWFRNNNVFSRACRLSRSVWHTHKSRWIKPNPFKVINKRSSAHNQWIHKVSDLSESQQHRQNITIY